jgi:hypothetical protein
VPKSTHDPFGLDALFLIRDAHALHADFKERGAVQNPLPAEAGDFMLKTPEGYILVFSSSV